MEKQPKFSQVKKMDDIIDEDMQEFEESVLEDQDYHNRESFDPNFYSSSSNDENNDNFIYNDFSEELFDYDPFDLIPNSIHKYEDEVQMIANKIESLKENIKPPMKAVARNEYYDLPIFMNARLNQGLIYYV